MSKFIKLTVTKPFFITNTKAGEINAKKGDILTVSKRSADYYNIHKLNNTQIFSIWQRTNWVMAHCKE